MNLELLNPFSQSFPEGLETSFDAAAISARFNPRGVFAGHFLAVGRVDGIVAVLDFETKGIVRWLEGHVKAVTTVCWSQNSRYLLTASKDWNVIVWDLSADARDSAEGERKHTVRFDAPVTSASLHPRNSKLLVVTLFGQEQPVFVDLRSETGGRWALERTGDDEEQEEGSDGEAAPRRISETATICRFSPKGDLIYVGSSRARVHVWDVRTKQHLWTEHLGGSSAVRHMEFDRTGTALVLNSNDRVIRFMTLLSEPRPPDSDSDEPMEAAAPQPRPPRVPYFEIQHKFQDLVNRTSWNGVGFSRDGEYVIGGAGHKASHNVYMWNRDTGGLVKILEGPKDPLEDLDWHPLRPLIASVSSLGFIHVWVTRLIENWSAYAPEFEELDENQEYEEKEDEFDFEDEFAANRRKADEQDKFVDIMTTDTVTGASSSIRDPQPAGELAVASGSDGDGEDAARDAEAAYEAFVRLEPDGDDDEAFYPPPDIDPKLDDPDENPNEQELLFGLLPPEKDKVARELEKRRQEKQRLVEEAQAAARAAQLQHLSLNPLPPVDEVQEARRKRKKPVKRQQFF